MKKLLFFSFTFITISGLTLFSQYEWTLEDCINYALENNIQVKRQLIQAELSKKDYNQSKYNLLPDVNAGFEHIFSSGRSLNTENYIWENRKNQDGSLGISSNLLLFNGLKNYNNIDKNHFDFLSALESAEETKNEISLQIAAVYLQILFDQELVEIAKSQLEITELQAERMSKMVEVGNRAKGDLLDILAQIATENLNVTNARNQLNISILNLTQLLDLDSVGNFTVSKPNEIAIEDYALPKIDNLFENALTNFPQIKSAEYDLKSSEKSLAIAKADLYPNLYLNVLYYSRYNKAAIHPLETNITAPSMSYPYSEQLGDNQYRSMSLNLSIPIFNKLQTKTNVSKAKINLNDQKLNLDQTKQLLYKDIQQAYADALAALDKYYSAKDAVTSNSEAFNYMHQRFNVGLVSSIDFNEAKNNLTRAKSEYTQAKYEYIFKSKILDFYMGLPITL